MDERGHEVKKLDVYLWGERVHEAAGELQSSVAEGGPFRVQRGPAGARVSIPLDGTRASAELGLSVLEVQRVRGGLELGLEPNVPRTAPEIHRALMLALGEPTAKPASPGPPPRVEKLESGWEVAAGFIGVALDIVDDLTD